MKIIIDIPDKVVEQAKESPNYYPTYQFELLWKAVAKGKIYECVDGYCTEMRLTDDFRTLEFLGEGIKHVTLVKKAKMVMCKNGGIIFLMPNGEAISVEELECYSEMSGQKGMLKSENGGKE